MKEVIYINSTIIVLNLNNLYDALSMVVLVMLLIATINYFTINKKQKEKIVYLEKLIKQMNK